MVMMMKDDDGDDEVEDAYEDGDDDDANIGKMEMFFVECLYIWNKFE